MTNRIPTPDALDDELRAMLDFERAVSDALAMNHGRSGGGSRG